MTPPAPLEPFHLAFPVDDLAAARHFYGEVLGCAEGRSSETWVDFDFFGHQLVAHLVPGARRPAGTGHVDGHGVPVPHFGIVLEWNRWHALADRMQGHGVAFALAPGLRFVGQPGEPATMFFLDPAGNAIEMKAFRDPSNLFAR